MIEKWVDVAGYKGLYKVSNAGRVRSLDRVVSLPHNHNKARKIKGKIIKPFDNGHGYYLVQLKKAGDRKNYYVHRLVAIAFLGMLKDGDEVNHKDYNRKNNNVDNLEIVSHKENIAYSSDHHCVPRRSCSKSGKKHIYFRGGKYSVEVIYLGKYYGGGRFDCLEEAVKVRNELYEKINYYK